jgi:hypothetical protein
MKRLSPEEYWKWRAYIAELWNAESKERAGKHEMINLQIKAQLAHMESQLFFYKNLKKLTDEVSMAKSIYNELKVELEEKLGISLSNCVIDEVTHEIKKLEE